MGLSLGLALAIPVWSTMSQAHAAAESDSKLVATIKVEIRQADGTVLKGEPQTVDWDQDSTINVQAGEHTHAVALTVRKRDDKGTKLGVTVAYRLDGNPIIAPFDYETKAKKREIVRTDGGIALAITVTPKVVKVPPPSPPKDEHDLDLPDGDDPLAGLK
jgi:hypothetical protein